MGILSQSQRVLVMVGLAVKVRPTYKLHRKCIKIMHFLCQSCVLMRPTCDTGHCLVWWPSASFGGQAPRWYPRFTLGDLFVTTLVVKWPGASYNGQAPRWYPR